MKTSCVSHPPNAPLIVVHQWQVDMMNGDTTAAKLMSFFEYWHNVKLSIAQSENGLVCQSDLIQHHSEPELEYGLLVDTSRKSIRSALKRLYQLGVLSLEKNPYNPHDRTRHFLFHPNKAQKLADQWNEVYSRHREEFGCKHPVCIPENLMNSALGQNADCNRPKGRMQSAKMPAPVGQNAASIRPNGLDPKTTSKTSTKTSLPRNTPLPPQGEFSSGDMAVKNNASTGKAKNSRKKKDILEAAPPALVEWAEQVTSDLFDDWRKFVFQPARPTSACSRRDFTRSLLIAVLEDEYEPKRIEQGFRLWIEAGQTALRTGKELFGVPDSSRAARRNRTTGDEPKWVGYLEAWEDQSSSLTSENLKAAIANQLRRLGRSAVLPPAWQQQTSKQTVGELTPREMQAYLVELQSEGVKA